jgi:hypothetical protein
MFDKRDLELAVREQLRPVLKRAGFSRFVGRNAWRITSNAVDIVAVQLAREEIDEEYGNYRPSRTFFAEMGCCFRGALPVVKRKRTGESVPAKLPRLDECNYTYRQSPLGAKPSWEVSANGLNLPRLIKAMIEHVVIDGLPWFEAKHEELRRPLGKKITV